MRTPAAARRAAGRWWAAPTLLFLTVALPLLVGGRWGVDTGFYTGIALSAWRTGRLWTLHAGEALYFNKPPLAFWLHGASISALGPGLWSIRLPVLIEAFGCVLATGAIVSELLRARRGDGGGGKAAARRAAAFSAAVLATTPEFLTQAAAFRLDYLSTLCMLLAVWAVLSAERPGATGATRPSADHVEGAPHAHAGWIVASGLPLGLALLTKPLLGLLCIPLFAVWFFARARPRDAAWTVGALGLALAVAAPWHLSMAALHGHRFVDEYFGRQSVARALGTGFEPEPWWWYFPLLARTYWPWGLVALPAVLAPFGPPRPHRAAARAALGWTFAWLLAATLFADKRRQYLLPVYPGLAALCGLWLAYDAPGRVRGLLAVVLRPGPLAAAATVSAVLSLTVFPRLKRTDGVDWPALRAAVMDLAPGELWNGSITYTDAGAVYTVTGLWPRPMAGTPGAAGPDGPPGGSVPPPGAVAVYDLNAAAPPEGAEVLARAGKFVVGRLAAHQP